jgi:Ca2+-binding RTX toxin-like protein
MATIKQVVGTSANDTLDGGLGLSEFRELFGGSGNDTYFIDMGTGGATTFDKVLELPGGGTDTVILVNGVKGAGAWTGSRYVLPEQVENLSAQGAVILNSAGTQIDTIFPAITVIGNKVNNLIITGSGNDTLFGGLGDDTLKGGGGADTYFVNSTGDVVVEGTDPYFLPGGAGAATDTVNSFVTFTLVSGVENLVLDARSGNVNGTGNSLANIIQGSDGNNIIDGGAGNDTLSGGLGSDTLRGGDGNDDLNGSEQTGTTFTEFDNIALTVALAVLSNGADLLDGGNGDDILRGFDRDTLLGGAGNDILNGNFANPTPNLSTPNEVITMDGGAGDDLFQNFGPGDIIKGGAGIDTVLIDFGAGPTRYTLPADVERGILANASSTVDTLTGNALDNYLQGNAGNDKLVGLAGDDVLDGGTGADLMIGGDGNDYYMVDDLGDSVVEDKATGGNDTVFSYIANYTLGANLENLVLEEGTYAGGTGGLAVNGKGNALDNLIVGNSRNNLLEGGAGNDTLDGGTGNDTLIGGAGNDIYYVDRTSDIVQELADYTGAAGLVTGGIDTVWLVDDLTITPLPAFRGIRYTLADNVENLNASAITRTYDDANKQLSVSITLEGNAQANIITGSMLNDTIIGGGGNDTMLGGAGNDTFYVQDAGDVVTETLAGAAGGTDTVMFSASLGSGTYILANNVENLYILGGSASKFIGNGSNNLMVGNDADNVIDGGAGNDTLRGGGGNDTLTDSGGNNILDGGIGNDTMRGGSGDDTYYVDRGDGADTVISSTAEDVIVDAGGKDTVRSFVYSYTLGAGLENLELLGNAFNGIGSLDNNRITGNANNNLLDGKAGNDTLDGGPGADTMIGGTGNDIFYVDNPGDIVREVNAASGGIDTVISTIDFNLQDIAGSDSVSGGVENLTLALGAAGAIRASGTGGANVLTGNEFNNILDGGFGKDSLIGGDGNDTYVVSSIDAKITELDSKLRPSAGTADVIYASLPDGSAYVMDKNVEQLHLVRSANPNGTVTITGNDSDNFIWGNFGNNTISGGLGNDVITGGAGDDKLDGGAGDDILNGDGLYQDSHTPPAKRGA